ncbi:MAG: hypothetical protein OIF54_13175 [Cohaesibacter sp.]|nr:hypothetical protein [Cohaesibacter sp.]
MKDETMSVIRRTFDRMIKAREAEARRYVEAYIRNSDRGLLSQAGFDADEVKVKDAKYLPF